MELNLNKIRLLTCMCVMHMATQLINAQETSWAISLDGGVGSFNDLEKDGVVFNVSGDYLVFSDARAAFIGSVQYKFATGEIGLPIVNEPWSCGSSICLGTKYERYYLHYGGLSLGGKIKFLNPSKPFNMFLSLKASGLKQFAAGGVTSSLEKKILIYLNLEIGFTYRMFGISGYTSTLLTRPSTTSQPIYSWHNSAGIRLSYFFMIKNEETDTGVDETDNY